MHLPLKQYTIVLLVLVNFVITNAQLPTDLKVDQSLAINKISGDSLKCILHHRGTFEGHFRNFFMTTINREEYPDYYAWAMGGGIGYYSPIIKGFQLGLSGFVVYNVASSPLSPSPPFSSRYEIGLFDITNPDNRAIMNRLEDLYIRYYFTKTSKSFLQVGKFHLKTPMINVQDGRMQPNLQEGFWGEWNELKKIRIKGGWIWQTSPRSTIQWFDVGQSLVYPNGRAVDGTKADYSSYTKSNFIAIGNITWKPVKYIEYQSWNYFVDKLFNMSLQKIEFKKPMGIQTVAVGIQYTWQKSMFNDTLSINQQYIARNEQSHTFSGRISVRNEKKSGEWNVNYTRITSHSRFLFPREWGIEPFYTFMQRERIEGAGDVHAATIQHIRNTDERKSWEFSGAAGMYWMPSVNDARLNKYAMPSYYQLNARSRYRFQGSLDGLSLELLYVYKGSVSDIPQELPIYFHNKVAMHHVSLVIDYFF